MTTGATGRGRALDVGRVEAVAIGASHGGVDALISLLPGLDPRVRVPVVIVLHLSRERPSLLAEVLTPHCRLPVIEAEDQEPLHGGRVYLATPDYHLLVDRGPRLALSLDEPVNFSRPAIDVLFESAADIFGPGLLAILLTGASPDGAEGLQAVRRAGGQAVVQDPAEARAPAMPRAALARGAVEAVLNLREIRALLSSLSLLETSS
jgi:two-component system chemotaxis response regulator CheB